VKDFDTPKMVITILGVALLIMVAGGGYLNYLGREIDPRYFEIITIIVMGLVALLKTGGPNPPPVGTQDAPMVVQGTGKPDAPPVAVEQADGLS
jgi:hypothetical protein